jgi:hypothetical protein
MRRGSALAATIALGLALWIAPAGAVPRAADNGVAKQSGPEILAAAKAATASSEAVRVSGTVNDDGKVTSLDIVSAQGRGGGTVTRDGATIEVVVVPPDVYLKADAESWKKIVGTATAAQVPADTWLQTTTADAKFGSFSELLDIGQLTDSIGAIGKATKATSTTFRGKKAVMLRGPNRGKLYVASTGKPYILGIEGTGAKKGSVVLFTEYDTATVPSAPTDAVDLEQVERSSGQSA